MITEACYRESPFSRIVIVAPSVSLCYGQFCIFSTFSSLSLVSPRSRSPTHSPLRVHAPVKPFTFSSFAYRKKERKGRRNVTMARPSEVFYGFVLRCVRGSSPSSARSPFPTHILARQITKNVHVKLILVLTLTLRLHC